MGKTTLGRRNGGSESLGLNRVWLGDDYPQFTVKRLRIIEVSHLPNTLQDKGRVNPLR